MRLRRLLKTEDHFLFCAARREAWEDLMWVYDLYESPPYIPFDTACDVVGLDAEDIRSAISNEFGDELRRLSQTISEKDWREAMSLYDRQHWRELELFKKVSS